MPSRSVSLYLAIAGLLAGLWLMYAITRASDPAVREILPATNPYQDSIASVGLVEAVNENVMIGVPVSALVTDVFVEVWARVKKDDPLFQLDTRDLNSQLNIEKSALKVSEAQIARLQDQLKRLQSAKDPRAVSQEDVKTRANDVTVAEAQLAAAQSQVKNMEVLVDRMTIRAPKDGVIIQRNIRPGEYVTTNASPPPMVLGDLGHLQIRVDVDENNANRVRSDADAVAYPKNNTLLKIPLRFNRIDPYVIPKRSLTGFSGERVDTRVLQVIYTLDQPKDFPLYVGQQMDVFIKDPSK